MSENNGFPNRGPSVLAVTTTTLVVASILVLARLVSRVVILRRVTCDDYFIILGWILAFGVCFSIDYGTSKGLGRYDANIDPSWIVPLRRCIYAFSVFYNPTLMATKTSILIFYLRIFKDTEKGLRIASYITLAVVNVAGIVLTFLNIFQCKPISAAVAAPGGSAQCIPLVTLYLASAPVNIITDLAILVLPLPVLTRMHLPRKQKNVLVFTFTLGIFVTIVNIVRIWYLQQASIHNESTSPPSGPPPENGGSKDFAWYASLSLMWTAVEVNSGIICACIPTLKPLILRILPKLIDPSAESASISSEKSETLDSQPDVDGVSEPHERFPSVAIIGTVDPPPAGSPAGSIHNEETELSFADFLNGPGMSAAGGQTKTLRSLSRADTTFFGFVNTKQPKSMLETTGWRSLKYCTIVTILFFLWGFSYGLLNRLNGQISALSHGSTSQTLGLQSAYFGGYIFGPLMVGRWVLIHGGFKATFLTGLCVYGTGTLMFWPCAVLTSFPGFIVSNFVVASGLSILETAANPFIVLCGPPDYGEMRLLFAQGVQAIGSIVSSLLAQALFAQVNGGSSLIDFQWAYLAISLFAVILAVILFYIPLPEATGKDLQKLAELTRPQSNSSVGILRSPKTRIGKHRVVYITLALGVLAQTFYVGMQESVSVTFSGLLASLTTSTTNLLLTPTNYMLTAHGAFAFGRFSFAALCLIIKPRVLLLLSVTGVLLFSILIVAVHSPSGTTPLSPNTVAGFIIAIFFFEGPLFPLIFAISLRRMGRSTKSAAAFITAAVGSGAVFPWVVYAVQVDDGKTVLYSFCVIVALSAAGLIFPTYLNLFPAARYQVDSRRHLSEGHRLSVAGSDMGSDYELSGPRRESTIGSLSSRFNAVVTRFKDGEGQGRRGSTFPLVEHVETPSLES